MSNLTAPRSEHSSSLAGVVDRATAQATARKILGTALNSTMTNAAYFARVCEPLLTGLLLAASRGGYPFAQVCLWADECQHPDNMVPTTLARLLIGQTAHPEDVDTFWEFDATYSSLRTCGDGERSAVWGTLEIALAPTKEPPMSNRTTPRSEHSSSLAGVVDRATAEAAARKILETALSSDREAYFAQAGARLLTALLLAASRGGHPFSQVGLWADECQHAGNKVPATLAGLLTGPDANPADQPAFTQFHATYVRLRTGGDGERSAVWGVLEIALGLYVPGQSLDT